MGLPSRMRLKGHRVFKYIHKNSRKLQGKFMDVKIVRSNPKILISHKNYNYINNFKLAITISKKISKKSVFRNKLRRKLQESFCKNFKTEYNHIPYWVLVNLKSGKLYYHENELLEEFHLLIFESGLLK